LKQTTFWHNLHFCHEAEQTRNTLKCLFCPLLQCGFRVDFIVFNISKLLLLYVLKEAATHSLARKVQFNIQTNGFERRLCKFYIQRLQLRAFPRWDNATETCCWTAIRNLKIQKRYSSYWAKRNSCWCIAWHLRKQFTNILGLHIKKVFCFLIRRHYLDTFFNEKAWWCGGEVGVDRLNSFVTTWWTGVGYLHIYIVQITTKWAFGCTSFFLDACMVHHWMVTLTFVRWSPHAAPFHSDDW